MGVVRKDGITIECKQRTTGRDVAILQRHKIHTAAAAALCDTDRAGVQPGCSPSQRSQTLACSCK